MTTTTFLPAETVAQQIAANVRAAAGARGVNASALARALGLAQSGVSKKWRGIRDWSFDELETMARFLEVSPWDLMGPATTKAPAAYGEGTSRIVRHQGLEPRTR